MPQHILARRAFSAAAALSLACTVCGAEPDMTREDVLARLRSAPLLSMQRMEGLRDAFPRAIALASSWDPDLVREVNAAIAREAHARGARMVLGPTLDIARDPRRGRVDETFGEDPYLVGEMGVAAVEGLQGKGSWTKLAPGKVIAAVGHLAGPQLPNEASDAGPAPVSERELREVFLPPFQAVLARTGAAVIVASRNEIDAVPSHANPWLLRDVLRREWKFKGAVIAAPGGVAELQTLYGVAASRDDAGRLALAAGVDADTTQLKSMEPASHGALDPRVRALALRAAQRSIVLLKNDGTLPLPASARQARATIAVIESRATGSFVEALRAALAGRAEVVAIADDGQKTRAALAALGKPLVVVLAAGVGEATPEILAAADALIAAGFLGEQGGVALADVIAGKVNPGGKLPVTVARQAGQLPLFYNAKPSARRGYLFDTSEPLFPFGHGLSYTTFELGAPRLASATMAANGSVEVSVEVRNTGKRAGDETVQLYVRDKVSSVARPVKELKGFRRVSLAAGERRTVTFTLNAASLEMWNERMRRVVEPGDFDVMTGASSAQLQATTLKVLDK